MEYSIYGAGATDDNRIIVKVTCGEPAVIPYIVKYEGDDSCNPVTEFYNYKKEVDPITTCNCGQKPPGSCDDWVVKKNKEGSFIGEHNLEVYYEIISELDCHEDPNCKTGCTVGNYWIKKGEGNSITVKYELFKFKDCNTITKEIKTAVTECSSDVIKIETECSDFYVKYECQTGCTDPGSTTVNIRGVSFNPTAVEYTGGTVYATISYEKIVKDKECNEKKTIGSFIITVDAPNCDDICDCENSLRIVTRDDDAPNELCCVDHNIDVNISKNDILSKLGLSGDDIKVIYKNKQIGESLTASILQKADPNPDCDKDCDYKTTYCVLEDTTHDILVGYETYWGSRDWSGKEVPPYGGRVKVSFDYLATATPIDSEGREIIGDKKCKPYSFNGSDSVIIEVPACEEIKEEDILKGEILYKERTDGCNDTEHVSNGLIKDTITGEDIIMNKISYSVKQVCTGTCDPIEYKKYIPLKIEDKVDKCASKLTGEVSYTLIKVKEDCTTEEIKGGKENVTIQISPNQTNEEITVENEYFIYTQAAGPCKEGKTCDCDTALTIINKDIPDPPEPTPPGPTPTDCDVEDDDTLDGYIANITKGKIDTVLTNIVSATNTKCTYKYLKAGYDTVKDKPQATISWLLANMMAELTPYVISTPQNIYLTLQEPIAGDTATNYFVNASHKYGGLKLNYFTSEQTYNERIDGAIQYALFKHSDYDGTNKMAENARAELREINPILKKQAKMRHDTDQDPTHRNPFFTKDEAIHLLPIVPNEYPTNDPCENGCDWAYTQSIINQYPDAQSLSNVHNFQALRDKDYDNAYFASILGLSGDKWADYLYDTQDLSDAGGNQMKNKFKRPRPGTQNNLNLKYGRRTFSFPEGHPNAVVYMCDCNIEYGGSTTGGASCDYCVRDIDNFTNINNDQGNPYMSYSSGHSSRAMINLLTTLEVAGDSMNADGYTSRIKRIMDYCHNRVVVRAHWKSDTIAGKLASAAQIGYLNGYYEFHEDVNKLKNS